MNKNTCTNEVSSISRSDLIKKLINRNLNNKTYDCEICGKKFNSASNKSRHKKICETKDSELIDLKNVVKDLENELFKVKNMINTNNTTNNTINIQINNSDTDVYLRPFGQENMTPLNIQIIGDLFLNLNIPELLKILHCNPDYPENHNIRIKSVKRKAIEIYRGDKWDIVTYVKGLNEYLLQGYSIFQEYYGNYKETIKNEMTQKELEDTLIKLKEIRDLNTDVIKNFYDDTILMLESIRTIDKNDHSVNVIDYSYPKSF